MAKRLFGTDGVRGVANGLLTPNLALKLGRAAGAVMREGGIAPLRVVIGRDTRRSGPMLSAALAAGFASAGIDVVDIGVVPTPAVSWAIRNDHQPGYALGAVVSASHNPAPDNGIKFFGPDSRKLSDELEERIEALLDEETARPTGSELGTIVEDASFHERWPAALLEIVPEGLEGVHVAIDAANGAASASAKAAFEALGAKVTIVNDAPNGDNINVHCGATHPDTIQELTKSCGAEFGVAFDGDADRAIFSDAKGRLINGDRTIAIWAAQRQKEENLEPPIVVGTVMSNGGVEAYLDSLGIKLERTPVGDKYVSQRIDATGSHVGGEQSGHIVFPERGPTGDGIATALELIGALRRSGRTLEQAFDDYSPWPQLLVNVTVADRTTWNDGEEVQTALAQAERDLVGHGRINVRASGTQPMVRVMVEADDEELRDFVAASVVGALTREAGGKIYSRVDLTHSLGE